MINHFSDEMIGRRTSLICKAAAIGAGLFLLSLGAAVADAPYAMAPPVGAPQDQGGPNSPDDAAASVFNWSDVPQNQDVPINRACFDQGGYQLYDTAGETIVVPFSNQNLYVMKFAESDNGTMYFVNEGDAPVLFVPQGGYLENATVDGARWYPFPDTFHPAQPVFLGIAPSWSVFIGMGWYPNMIYHGGFWGSVSFWGGGVFTPTVGLFFDIGGHPCYGWNDYHSWCNDHPTFVHITIYQTNIYHWSEHPVSGRPQFHGFGPDRFEAYRSVRHDWDNNQNSHGGNGSGNFHAGNGPDFGGAGNDHNGGNQDQDHHVFRGVVGGNGGNGGSNHNGNGGGAWNPGNGNGGSNNGNNGQNHNYQQQNAGFHGVFGGGQGNQGGSNSGGNHGGNGSGDHTFKGATGGSQGNKGGSQGGNDQGNKGGNKDNKDDNNNNH